MQVISVTELSRLSRPQLFSLLTGFKLRSPISLRILQNIGSQSLCWRTFAQGFRAQCRPFNSHERRGSGFVLTLSIFAST